jgi:hypothetical protein
MKAILEFNYPNDEDKLRHAIHAEEAFQALRDMSKRVAYRWRKGDAGEKAMLESLEYVRYILDEVLTNTGETNAERIKQSKEHEDAA